MQRWKAKKKKRKQNADGYFSLYSQPLCHSIVHAANCSALIPKCVCSPTRSFLSSLFFLYCFPVVSHIKNYFWKILHLSSFKNSKAGTAELFNNLFVSFLYNFLSLYYEYVGCFLKTHSKNFNRVLWLGILTEFAFVS